VDVILLEKIRNLGSLGEKVKVKPGYARNFLVPQGKAVYATKDNVVKFEQRRAELEAAAAGRLEQAKVRQQEINALAPMTIIAKASEEGKLYGSVGTRDIAALISKTGVHVEKREIRLSEGLLRLVGEYDITIELEGDLTATVKLTITSEG